MKRDWEIIRVILISAEDKPVGIPLANKEITGYDPKIVAAHMELLGNAGYAEVKTPGTNSGFAMLNRLTLQGYDLLDTMRSDSLWSKIKTTAQEKSVELTFELVKMLAAKFSPEIFGS